MYLKVPAEDKNSVRVSGGSNEVLEEVYSEEDQKLLDMMIQRRRNKEYRTPVVEEDVCQEEIPSTEKNPEGMQVPAHQEVNRSRVDPPVSTFTFTPHRNSRAWPSLTSRASTQASSTSQSSVPSCAGPGGKPQIARLGCVEAVRGSRVVVAATELDGIAAGTGLQGESDIPVMLEINSDSMEGPGSNNEIS